jgi:hypothetical protein
VIGKLLRPLVLAAALPAFMLALTQPAIAQEPVCDPTNGCFPVDSPFAGCPDFTLGLTTSGGNLHTKVFTDKAGNTVRFFQAGKGVLLTFTNLGTDPNNPVPGKSISIRTDGTVLSVRNNPDGTQTFTATGHNGFILFPADEPGPATFVYTGRVVFNVASNGVATLVSESGTKRDVCAELAQ